MKKPRKSIPLSVRFAILKRDKFTCQYCGKHPPHIVLEIDHIVPVCEGGTDDMSNLVASCFACNRGKSKHSLTAEEPAKITLHELTDDQLYVMELLGKAHWRVAAKEMRLDGCKPMDEDVTRFTPMTEGEYIELGFPIDEARQLAVDQQVKKELSDFWGYNW